MKITELKDTSALMESPDYKDRFRAEYYQVAIRYEKLKAMLDKWDKGELNFTPTCSRVTYDFQMHAMEDYKAILAERADIEHVEL